ncbi:MAG: hypothetical protein LWX08_15605 [Deltaproteobacteria bacterium]|nr:hypothetical protein [Deltaproteobacteria bacterium]
MYPLKGIPGKLVEEPLEIVYMPEKIALEKDKLRKNSFLKKFNQFNKLIEADLYALSLINESSSAMSKSTAVEILKCLKIMIESYKELSGSDDIDKKLKFVKEKLNNNGWNSLNFNEFIIGSLLSLFTECDTDGNTVHGLIHYIHQKSYNAFMSCVEIPPVDININFNSSNISITKLKDWPGTNWILKKMINRLKKSMGRFSVSIVVCGNTFYTYIKSGAESAQVHVKFEPPSTGGVVHIEYQESDTDEFNQLRLLFFKQILEAVGMKVEVIKNQYLNALLDKNNLQNRHQATEAFLYFIGSASYGYKVEMYLSDIVKKGFHAKATEAARQLAKIYMAEGNL